MGVRPATETFATPASLDFSSSLALACPACLAARTALTPMLASFVEVVSGSTQIAASARHAAPTASAAVLRQTASTASRDSS